MSTTLTTPAPHTTTTTWHLDPAPTARSGYCPTGLETGGILVGEDVTITLDVQFVKA